MEEGEVRFAELRKASYEFERDIVKGSVNARTGKVVAEKVQRYLEDKLRARVKRIYQIYVIFKYVSQTFRYEQDTLTEKLRLKNATLKVQKKKLHMQLKQVTLYICQSST